MIKRLFVVSIAGLALLAVTGTAFARGQNNPNPEPVVYVTSQGLYYDSIVTADPLPQRGRFQKLELGPGGQLQTQYGPGNPGYLGGRWWMDSNENGIQDSGDHFFMCPLLGPGRTSP